MEQTLLLNATYEPLKVVHWQKAVTLWCQGKVEVISSYEREVRSPSFKFRLPSVIRLLRYIKIKRNIDYVPFSRANIYARDNHACQYCGDAFPTQDLTFDHVVPVAQGGRKDWEFQSGPSERLQSGLTWVSTTPRTAGGITSTGTWSSTRADVLARSACPVSSPGFVVSGLCKKSKVPQLTGLLWP
jgi:hypothetical protein